MNETISIERMNTPDVSIIRFAGILDNQIKGRLEELASSLATDIIADFTAAERINSMGITVLLKVMKQLHGEGSRIYFVHLNRLNTKLFRMVGLTKIGKIFDAMDDALHYISTGNA